MTETASSVCVKFQKFAQLGTLSKNVINLPWKGSNYISIRPVILPMEEISVKKPVSNETSYQRYINCKARMC